MLKKLLNFLEDKKIVILGYGIEGASTYRFLRNNFKDKVIYIVDKNTNLLDSNIELVEDENVEVSLGDNYLNGIEEYDLIIKAPGISLKDVDISKFKDKITNQLELFLEYIDVYSIGITGTKGKSTTSTLIYKILQDQQKDSFLLGNIGEPIFNDIEYFKENSIAVLELSSHALEYVKKSPNISILLDVYEEHLDHYKSLEKYIEAKFNVAKFQNQNDYFIYNYDNELMRKYNFDGYKENDYAISQYVVPDTKNYMCFSNDGYIMANDGTKYMHKDEDMILKGMHNVNNIMFIYAVARILNLDMDKVLDTIKEFKPLEHRMEFVGIINQIEFYNDSIATIPEATMNAVNALGNINTLIVGGKDRGVDLTYLINFLNNSSIENIICLPKTGEYIYDALKDSGKNMYSVQKLEEAVKIAKEVTKINTACLLSPAASSYGYFKNFEERGRLFKQYVIEN